MKITVTVSCLMISRQFAGEEEEVPGDQTVLSSEDEQALEWRTTRDSLYITLPPNNNNKTKQNKQTNDFSCPGRI